MRSLLLAGVASLGLAGTALATPVISDPSFENVSVGTYYGRYDYDPTDSGVTFTGNSGIAANGSVFGFASAPDGGQVGFIESYHSNTSSIAQMVTGLTVGATYSFSFDAAARPSFGGDPFTAVVSSAAATILLGTFNPTSTSFTAFTTANFVATAATETLTFTTFPGGITQDLSTAIDLITINTPTAVPEPASLALLALPMGVAGLFAKRRRKGANRA